MNSVKDGTKDEATAPDVAVVTRAPRLLAAGDLDHEDWHRARVIRITRYWSGEGAPGGRHAEARLLWSDVGLLVRFACPQTEPFVINPSPQTSEKTIGLWDRDVCEIFVRPRRAEPNRYFEFEVAPTGEWLDLSLRRTGRGRETNWEFRSGMTSAARVGENNFTVALCVPWKAFGERPRTGETWRGNLFRCVGSGETRGYLAWRPTRTPLPDFHVPEAFGRFIFEE